MGLGLNGFLVPFGKKSQLLDILQSKWFSFVTSFETMAVFNQTRMEITLPVTLTHDLLLLLVVMVTYGTGEVACSPVGLKAAQVQVNGFASAIVVVL